MDGLLKITDLTVGFDNPAGSMTAVKHADLAIAQGQTVALVGESGCGKTVMCKSILGLLCSRGRIRSGSIYFDGRDISSLTDKQMVSLRGGEISMVFQDPMTSLDPAFSVGEQIAEVLRVHEGLSAKEARAEAVKMMELVKIPDAASRYDQRPYQFSGGMRQRISIAAALAAKPKLLLADEPTTALDETTRSGIMDLLRNAVRETGAAMLFITHDLSLVEGTADRVAVMKDGVIVEEGSTADVLENPQHEYTKKLLGYLNYSRNKGHDHRSEPERTVPLVEVRHLHKTYAADRKKRRTVIDDMSFVINRGEIIGVVGRSGCGKSTLSRCLTGLESYDSGEIIIKDGTQIQMIFQDTGLSFNDRMTIEEIIAEPLMIKGGRKGNRGSRKSEARALVQDVMAAVELDSSLKDRRPYELSGGQRQRAAIARALITAPDLIIADEPLTGLDVTAQAQIVHLFRKLSDERDLAVMFIAHDLPMVNHISSRIIEFR